MSETASTPDVALRWPGGELPLRVVPSTEGSEGIDTSKLLATTGQVALDIGFVNTASCTSAITYIDGDQGILRYRGYPIDQLARSDEHTSELQSRQYLVCRLLLEKQNRRVITAYRKIRSMNSC